jgi:hypothetical protein
MIPIQLFSTFDSNIYLEMAISTLEMEGIKKEAIFAVPLDNREEAPRLLDSIHSADGTSLIDIGMALATAFSVIGTSIGFKLSWGPIFWGIISAFIGFVIGVGIRFYMEVIVRRRKRLKGKRAEIILVIDCTEEQVELVENILWEHFAMGVAKVK